MESNKGSSECLQQQRRRKEAQRENLEEKVKSQQTRISELEQVNAELRRSKVALEDEERRKAKLEDRHTAIVKELSEKITALEIEKTNAVSDRDQVRKEARSAIRKWQDAERSWQSENEKLSAAITLLNQQLTQTTEERDDAVKTLRLEQERAAELHVSLARATEEIECMVGRLEKLQGQISSRDESIRELYDARSNWNEVCSAKDEEIYILKGQLACATGTVAELQTSCVALEERGREAVQKQMHAERLAEQLDVKLKGAQDQCKWLQHKYDTLHHSNELLAQTSEKQQEMITELRAKLIASQEAAQGKSAEVLEKEQGVNRLQAEVHRLERGLSDARFANAKLETALSTANEERLRLADALDSVSHERDCLQGEIQDLKGKHTAELHVVEVAKGELIHQVSLLERDVTELTAQVAARQETITSLTTQLQHANAASEKKNHQSISESAQLSALTSHVSTLQQQHLNLTLTAVQLEQEGVAASLSSCEREAFGEVLLEAHLAMIKLYINLEIHCATVTDDKEQLAATVSLLQEDLTRAKDTMRVALQLNTACNMTGAELSAQLCAELSRVRENLNTEQAESRKLLGELSTSQGELRVMSDNFCTKVAELQEFSQNVVVLQSALNLAVTAEKAAQLELRDVRSLQEWVQLPESKVEQAVRLKIDILCDAVLEVLAQRMEAARGIREMQLNRMQEARRLSLDEKTADREKQLQETEKRVRDLSSQLKHAKRESVTINGELAQKVALLETQNERLQIEKTSLSQQLELASQRSLESSANWEGRHNKILATNATLQERSTRLEKQCRDLTEKLSEIRRRKEDYKEALLEVKSLRREGEHNRAREKEWAIAAISRANDEVLYWISCYDKLKAILGAQADRGAAQLSLAELDVLKKYDRARGAKNVFEDVQPSAQSEETHMGAKRPRKESPTTSPVDLTR